ncbi:MAG TPA: hypothetical protein ENK57_24100 [Polyangiaceae bacterium]|nr:hypothetical protein [Polyangiaceae bacterium]
MSVAKDFDKAHPQGADDRSVPRSGTYRRAAPGGSLEEYRQEHDDIRSWLDKLRTDDPVQLRVVLLGLRSVLLLHFANEEGRDGLFGLVRERWGQDHRIEVLRLQHHEMLSRVHRIQSLIGSSEPELGDVARLRDELIDLVSSHEERESELLQEVLLTDLGEGF